MKTRRYSLLLMSLAISFASFATPLTPSEALNLAMQKSAGPMRAQAQQMTLVKTCTAVNNQTPTLYVFSNTDKPGFMVLAADDYARRIVLGYSDTDNFDPNNIPPAMQWWLNAASASVMADVRQGPGLKLAGINGIGMTLQERPEVPEKLSAAPRHASKRVIAPLCATKWNQDAPYYNMCPMVGGKRSVTGCVATAMAQLMKYHNYPTKGTGSHSYEWTVNGSTYTTSANFGNTTYDWSNMLNTYTNSATTAQKNAVATLMYHCGVASDMSYSPSASGTSDLYAAVGAINYFSYDKSLQYLQREWYSTSEWDALVYGMLDAGLPLMYCGNDGEGGHAFVCDGIDASGYYHINWGWGGMADGYFELSDLNPYAQGIGGSTGEVGFIYGQSILYNFKPNAGGSLVPTFAGDGTLTTDKTRYSRSSGTIVTFTSGQGFFSYTPGTLSSATFGVYCEGNGINQFAEYGTMDGVTPLRGVGKIQVYATDFPVGSYDVFPAVKDASGTVYKMKVNEGTPKSVHFEVTSSTINVSASSTGGGEVQDGELSTAFKSWSPQNGSDDAFYAGNGYNFTFDLTSTGRWSGDLALVVFDDDYYIKCNSNPTTVAFDQAGTKQHVFSLTIPSDVAAGTYNISVCQVVNNQLSIVGPVYNMTINEALQMSGAATITALSLNNTSVASSSKTNPVTTTSDKQTIEMTLRCTEAPYVEYIQVAFADPTSLSIVGWTEEQLVQINSVNGTKTLTFTGPWSGLEYDKTYAIAVFNSTEQISNLYYIRISSTTGVAEIWSEDEGEPEYFNLQGVRVTNPGTGIYLKRVGNTVTKQVIR